MIKFLIKISLAIILLTASLENTLAFVDPLSVPNNKFGIHIFNEKDLGDAASLVNSNDGDWGYVTFVITEKERDTDRWQKAFDKMRRLHLIPIVRVATKQSTDGWSKPEDAEIKNWVSFFNSLNWVIKNRYIVIGNEVNHAPEWGGSLDPEGYAEYLKKFTIQLRQSSGDYFVLPAALDASAKNSNDTMDEAIFLKRMLDFDPEIFNYVDGWNSHSYPNPDFSGSETDVGRGSVRTFDWEITFLGSLGVKRSLPIFITETGWSVEQLSENDIGGKLKYSYENAWFDKRVVAVTPFILDYPNEPFRNLSWKRENGNFRDYYKEIQGLSKIKGEPLQQENGKIVVAFSQPIASTSSDYMGIILAKNIGQSIWNFDDVSIGSANGLPFIKSYSFNDLEPGRLGLIVFRATSFNRPGLSSSSLYLKGSYNQQISNIFPVETVVLNLDSLKISRFFGTMLSGFSQKGP